MTDRTWEDKPMSRDRQDFEDWANSEEGEFGLARVRNEELGIEAYASGRTFDAWRTWQAAVKHERAECAKVCEALCGSKQPYTRIHDDACVDAAAAIRARADFLPQQEG